MITRRYSRPPCSKKVVYVEELLNKLESNIEQQSVTPEGKPAQNGSVLVDEAREILILV